MKLHLAPTKDPVDIAPVGGVLSCAIPGCGIQAAQNHRGYCQVHDDAYLTRAYELTRTIGRGSYE